MSNSASILNSFAQITHRSIGNDSFQKWFTKIGWKVYVEIAVSKDSSTLKEIEILFSVLFTDKSNDLDNVLQNLRQKLGNHEDFEKFLNTFFYTTLIFYTKSFDNHPDGWEKTADLVNAFRRLISYCSSKENDPIFIFEDAMINTMEEIRSSKSSFSVFNTYLGVPIQYPATVLHTDNQSIIIRTKPIQILASLFQKGIYVLKNELLDYDVFASTKIVNIQGERCLRLYNFNPLNASFSHRQQVRVQTQSPFSVLLSIGNITYNCSTYDISLKGAAITYHEMIDITPNQEVFLTLPPQITSTSVKIKGKFLLRSAYENGFKYHFKLYPSLAQENLISYYISTREQQIIQILRRKAQ